MRLLIFGGRAYADWVAFCQAMEKYRGAEQSLTIIHGGATGADAMGEKWGLLYRAGLERFPADWKDLSHPDAVISHRKSGSYDMLAGFRRNQQMIDEGKPDRALECPGGSGTADMHRRLVRAGIPIEYVVKKPIAGLFD